MLENPSCRNSCEIKELVRGNNVYGAETVQINTDEFIIQHTVLPDMSGRRMTCCILFG